MSKIFDMPVADVYVHYINKIERKDRTQAELVKVITWLTGMDSKVLKKQDKLVDELAKGRPMEKILRSD